MFRFILFVFLASLFASSIAQIDTIAVIEPHTLIVRTPVNIEDIPGKAFDQIGKFVGNHDVGPVYLGGILDGDQIYGCDVFKPNGESIYVQFDSSWKITGVTSMCFWKDVPHKVKDAVEPYLNVETSRLSIWRHWQVDEDFYTFQSWSFDTLDVDTGEIIQVWSDFGAYYEDGEIK